MRRYGYYPLGQELNGIVLLFFFGLLSLAATNSAARGRENSEEQEKCYAAFAAQGLSEKEVWEVSEREVLKVCGSIPTYPVNQVWHANRDRPVGIVEQSAELTECYQALDAVGVSPDEVLDVSKERLIEVCGIVPALLD